MTVSDVAVSHAVLAGTLWYAAAVGVVSLTKLYRANEDKKPLPVLLLAVVAASGARPNLNLISNRWHCTMYTCKAPPSSCLWRSLCPHA